MFNTLSNLSIHRTDLRQEKARKASFRQDPLLNTAWFNVKLFDNLSQSLAPIFDATAVAILPWKYTLLNVVHHLLVGWKRGWNKQLGAIMAVIGWPVIFFHPTEWKMKLRRGYDQVPILALINPWLTRELGLLLGQR